MSETGTKTSHDTLCPDQDAPNGGWLQCDFCDLIERVRADEQDRAEKIILRHCGHTKYAGCQPCWHDLMARDLYEEA